MKSKVKKKYEDQFQINQKLREKIEKKIIFLKRLKKGPNSTLLTFETRDPG
jgi:hypothetical protein